MHGFSYRRLLSTSHALGRLRARYRRYKDVFKKEPAAQGGQADLLARTGTPSHPLTGPLPITAVPFSHTSPVSHLAGLLFCPVPVPKRSTPRGHKEKQRKSVCSKIAASHLSRPWVTWFSVYFPRRV